MEFFREAGTSVLVIICEPSILPAGTDYNLRIKVSEYAGLKTNPYEEHGMIKHVLHRNNPYAFEVFVKDKINDSEIKKIQENGYRELLEQIINPLWRRQYASEFLAALPILITTIMQFELTKPVLGGYLAKELYRRISSDSHILIYILCHCLTKVSKESLQLSCVHHHLLACSQINKDLLFSDFFDKVSEHGITLCKLAADNSDCVHIIYYLYSILGNKAIISLIKKSCSKMPSEKSIWCQVVMKYTNIENPLSHKDILGHLTRQHCPGLEAVKIVFDSVIAYKKPNKEQVRIYNEVFQHGVLVKSDGKSLIDDPIVALQFCAHFLPPEIDSQNILFVENVLLSSVNYLLESKTNCHDVFVRLCQHSAILTSSDGNLMKLLTILASSDHVSLQKLFITILKGDKFCDFKLPVSIAKSWIQKTLQNYIIQGKEKCEEKLQFILARLKELRKMKCFASDKDIECISNEVFEDFLNKSKLEYILMASSKVDTSSDSTYLEIHLLNLLSLHTEYIQKNFANLVAALTEEKSTKQLR